MLDFEWDDVKARANLAKHGVSFEEAKKAFDDPWAFTRYDDRFDYGEDRYVVVGQSASRILTIVYTERGERIRIIAAWPATRDEADAYYENTR
ncbi:BrnT family toxin [Terrarubrum flagellatum]|uniref:BrnT family toxin n=1 Tax=Terrirubrum flagellatum TaxID=2895980 RepID=UPI003145561A